MKKVDKSIELDKALIAYKINAITLLELKIFLKSLFKK